MERTIQASTVRDLVGRMPESAARLLLPIIDRRYGRATPWSAIVPDARLNARTSCASIRHLIDEDIDPPYADLHPETAELLTRALAQDSGVTCWLGLWKEYS